MPAIAARPSSLNRLARVPPPPTTGQRSPKEIEKSPVSSAVAMDCSSRGPLDPASTNAGPTTTRYCDAALIEGADRRAGANRHRSWRERSRRARTSPVFQPVPRPAPAHHGREVMMRSPGFASSPCRMARTICPVDWLEIGRPQLGSAACRRAVDHAQSVVYFSDGADGRARRARRGFLFDGNRGARDPSIESTFRRSL